MRATNAGRSNVVELAATAAEYSLLARALEVETESGTVILRGSWLAADPDGGALLIGSDRSAKPTKRNPSRGAVGLRERFTGAKRNGNAWEIQRLPKRWEELGKAVSILYESDKLNGGGTGKKELFKHNFSPGAMAYGAGEFLAIVGPRITVDASGVRN